MYQEAIKKLDEANVILNKVQRDLEEEIECNMCHKEECNCDDQVENMREQEDYKDNK